MKDKITNLLLKQLIRFAAFVGLTGIASCEDDKIKEIPVAYGTPHAKFILTGKVVDSNESIIKNIKLEIFSFYNGEIIYPVSINPIVSNDIGEFVFNYSAPTNAQQGVIVSDIDGELNGSFEDQTVFLEFEEAETIETTETVTIKEIKIVLKEK